MDSYRTTITLLDISADDESVVRLTNSPEIFSDGVNDYSPQPQLDFDLPEKTGAAGGSEGRISSIDTSTSSVLTRLANGYPYNRISIKVREVWLDDAEAITDTFTHFDGLLYQKASMVGTGYMELTIKDWKYYLDIPGGVPCTEFCFVSHFGDKVCQATVQSFPMVIDTISGNDVIVASVPVVDDFLFNKGFFKLGGTSIKVKFWESGTTFQTSEPMPASWTGQVVELISGCDKSLNTCRTIHNNEENFSGWGYSMVDYNPLFEEPTK